MRKINLPMFVFCVLVAFAFTEVKAVQPPSKNKTRAKLAKSLLYMRPDETSCRIWKLDLASGKSRIIYTAKAREASCPNRMDLNRKGRLLLVYKDGIQEIRLSPSIQKSPLIKYPEPKVKPNNFLARYEYAAYDARGNIMVEMFSAYPWDDEDIYIFRYQTRKWKLVRATRCYRLACGYDSYDGIRKRPRNAHIWGYETAAWHEKQKYNPFLVKKKTIYPATELTFKFGNKKTILILDTQPSSHSDTTLTMGVSLKIGKQKKKILASKQCETSLMGKYLIVYRYSKKEDELYNLETGTRIPLHRYTWAWVYH